MAEGHWLGNDKKMGVPIEQMNFEGYDFDFVVLLAANLEHDRQMYVDNLSIYNWAASNFPDAHFIYTSSAAVYGDSFSSCEENQPLDPDNYYGYSKMLGEEIIKATKTNYTILRLSNVYGNGDGNGVIDIFKNGGKTIYGNGEDIRDYVPVGTVCSAILKIIESPEKYNKNIYNVSTNKGTATLEAFQKYGKGEPKFVEARRYDIQHSVLSNYKAKRAGLI